jgi:6-pyruvoyltetrahydropterin/6-carboxytetrahydropterin synthase
MSAAITIRHGFEAAHRLPDLGNDKCASLHGHSWSAAVTVTADFLDERGVVVEFGSFKRQLRAWIDTHLDHGSILHDADPLGDALEAHGCKVFRMDRPPTVENIAALLADVSLLALADERGPRVTRVDVIETPTNAAAWIASW